MQCVLKKLCKVIEIFPYYQHSHQKKMLLLMAVVGIILQRLLNYGLEYVWI